MRTDTIPTDRNGTANAPDLADVVAELRRIREIAEAGAAELLDAEAVARLFGISVPTVFRLRSAKQIPQPIRLGDSGQLVRWRRTELLAFIAEQKAEK